MRPAPLAALAVLACCAFECAGPAASSRPRSFAEPELLATLKEPAVVESSGIAPSHLKPGAYYTHNDSGGSPRLFIFDEDGSALRQVRVRGARAVDWEDMASASLGGTPYVFVGDIGDNAGRRDAITVYRIPEPKGGAARPDAVYTLTYPDGKHNAEALLVHPSTGYLAIVTKTSRVASVYGLPLPGRTGAYRLERLGDLDLPETARYGRPVTGGAWSPDGRFVTLRTYLAAYEFPAADEKTWWNSRPVKVRLNLEFQGEAITYALDGRSLVTTSEGAPCPLSRVRILD